MFSTRSMEAVSNPPVESLFAHVSKARSAGMPREQVERFVSSGYVALPWALAFHAAARDADAQSGPQLIACGGARGPGKSHSIMGQLALDDCQREPELKCLFLRKVQKSAGESFDDLVLKVCRNVPHDLKNGNLYFPNGSRILVGGYNAERDIDKYLGLEYDVIALEEGTQITGDKRDKIRGSLRTSKANWRTRWYESTNPGGIGHSDFKRLYVEPHRKHEETLTRFFPSTYRDNPFLKPEYIAYLESLQGDLGRAWRDGDWDVFEGQVFSMWRRELHVIKARPIPEHWRKLRGVDWGFSAPFVCAWGAQDPDTGRVWVYRELAQRELTDREQARSILRLTGKDERISATYADPSMWTKKNMEDRTFSTEDEYAAVGVGLTKADNDRLTGKRKLVTMLSEKAHDGLPLIQFFENCKYLIDSIPVLTYDAVNVEDVDSSGDDHGYDAVRYMLTPVNPRPISKPPAEKRIDAVVKRMQRLRPQNGIL